MSIHNNPSDPADDLKGEVKSLQQNNESQKIPNEKEGAFVLNKKIVLIYHEEFFLSVYKKVFEKYGLEVTSFKEIGTESIAGISKIDPLVIVVIDDYLGKQVNYATQIEVKLKKAEVTKNMPVVLTSDRPPSEVAEDIIKIYSLNQNQK